jgi:hypothetical protein
VGFDPVSVEEIRTSVLDWFAHRSASLELPSGWFGRPFDNQHRLTKIEAEADDLVIRLDGDLELVLHAPSGVAVASDRVRIGPFDGGTWKWHECGSRQLHSDVVPPGNATFWATRGT